MPFKWFRWDIPYDNRKAIADDKTCLAFKQDGFVDSM